MRVSSGQGVAALLDLRRALLNTAPMPTAPRPIVAAIDMGYGHLRAAAPLADALSVPLQQMDQAPLGDEADFRFWERTRKLYEPLTRLSQLPFVGAPMQALLAAVTAIPSPWPVRDLSGPTQGTRWMLSAARGGVGRALAAELQQSGAPLVTTFYAAAILAEQHGAKNLHCVITDTDVNRVWAPPDPAKSRILYFAPSERARRRMESYGVPRERVRVTGFPLPHELVGGRAMGTLKENLLRRLVRLDPLGRFREAHGVEIERRLGPLPMSEEGRPPLLTFAVGGAGAQTPLAQALVRGVRRQIEEGKLRLALVAGRRAEVAEKLREAVRDNGLEGRVEVLEDPDVFSYLRRFNQLLAGTDMLWSKPSEITFFAALGLPLICAPPVGVHESWNQRWATDNGAALPQHDPATAGDWLSEWLEDGTLASAAWGGFNFLPKLGLYEILAALGEPDPA